MAQATPAEVTSQLLDGVGYHAAMEAPDQPATAMKDFVHSVDAA